MTTVRLHNKKPVPLRLRDGPDWVRGTTLVSPPWQSAHEVRVPTSAAVTGGKPGIVYFGYVCAVLGCGSGVISASIYRARFHHVAASLEQGLRNGTVSVSAWLLTLSAP